MGELITALLSSLSQVVNGVIGAIKEGFMSFIYVDPTAETLVVSDLAKFGFIMAGVAVALGLVGTVIHMVKARRG